MKRESIFIMVIFSFLLAACHRNEKAKSSSHFNVKVYETTAHQFGYDIYKDSARLIHQPLIPGASGNNGFASKEDAQKVADLMIFKLDNGIMPPSVTIKELDSLQIQSK